MLDGKEEYNCDKLWIITTSNLTQEATETALNNEIEIKPRDFVIEKILATLHEDKTIKFKQKQNNNKERDFNVKLTNEEKIIYEKLKQLRIKMAKELKMPIWSIYSNDTILLLVKNKPQTIEQLLKFKSLGHKKVDNYGNEILEIINS